jgi:hypothetical protein
MLECNLCVDRRSESFSHHWGSGSGYFWVSRIWIHKSEVRIWIRLRILPFSHKGVEAD